jgi:RimJ/RimL family protein N-acetyltransferase
MTNSISDLELITPRLILRPIRADDLRGITSSDSQGKAKTESWFYLRMLAGCWQLDGLSRFSVIERLSRQYVGCVGPQQPDGWPVPEVGWSIVPDKRGKGYAVEAARAAISWLFETHPHDEIVHYIPLGNVASQAVARKLGSWKREVGRLPTPYFGNYSPPEIEIWGQTKNQWNKSLSTTGS